MSDRKLPVFCTFWGIRWREWVAVQGGNSIGFLDRLTGHLKAFRRSVRRSKNQLNCHPVVELRRQRSKACTLCVKSLVEKKKGRHFGRLPPWMDKSEMNLVNDIEHWLCTEQMHWPQSGKENPKAGIESEQHNCKNPRAKNWPNCAQRVSGYLKVQINNCVLFIYLGSILSKKT